MKHSPDARGVQDSTATNDQQYIEKVNAARAANGMKPMSEAHAKEQVRLMRKLQRTTKRAQS